jgi:F420-non-reducing hydrogenase iron-sulfur subunit
VIFTTARRERSYMELSSSQQKVAVAINEEYCSRCGICSSVCPYEAIRRDTETGKMLLEIEKCQTCGICYSSCPAKAIDAIYYDVDSLISYLERARRQYESDTLVIMCKGSAPDSSAVEKLFGVSEFIPLSVPCVGRVPEEVLLKVIADMGIRRIHILACDEDYCRFERGSPITGRRITALNIVLAQLGYGPEAIELKRNSLKVKADRDKCIACGNCAFYCPYGAAKLESGAAEFDLTLCRGCGLCVTLCPAFALDLENWETERMTALISRLSAEMERPKIMVFRCQWSVFPSLDGEFDPNVRAVDLPCAARVEPLHILEAFQSGIDGVLIAACPEEDCKSKTGSKESKRLMTALSKTLGQIGFEERLRFCSVSPRYADAFKEELREFKARIESDYAKEGTQ